MRLYKCKQYFLVVLIYVLIEGVTNVQTTNENIAESSSDGVKKDLPNKIIPIKESDTLSKNKTTPITNAAKSVGENVVNPYRDGTELPDSFKTGFYVLIAISLTALILIIFKIYGLRLTRVERRYGVQGDRAAQELTPLPGAVDEDDSETDDHTVFDINRQQIRVA